MLNRRTMVCRREYRSPGSSGILVFRIPVWIILLTCSVTHLSHVCVESSAGPFGPHIYAGFPEYNLPNRTSSLSEQSSHPINYDVPENHLYNRTERGFPLLFLAKTGLAKLGAKLFSKAGAKFLLKSVGLGMLIGGTKAVSYHAASSVLNRSHTADEQRQNFLDATHQGGIFGQQIYQNAELLLPDIAIGSSFANAKVWENLGQSASAYDSQKLIIKEVNPNNIYFQHRGQVDASVTWMNLHFEWNILRIAEQMEGVCLCYKNLKDVVTPQDEKSATAFVRNPGVQRVSEAGHGMTLLSQIWAILPRLQKTCESGVQSLKNIGLLLDVGQPIRHAPPIYTSSSLYESKHGKSTMRGSPVPKARGKRQLISGGILLTAAVASGVGGFEIHKALFGDDTHEQITKKVDLHSQDLLHLIHNQKILKETISALRHNITQDHTDHEAERLVFNKLSICSLHTTNVHHYLDMAAVALDKLLRHEFPTGLFDLSELLPILPNIQKDLSTRNLRMLVEHTGDLLKLSTSYAYLNDSLHVFLHVPISSRPPLQLIEYVPVPVLKEEQRHKMAAYIIDLPHHYLMLSPDHRSFLEVLDISLCKEISHLRYRCPNTNVLRHDKENSCLYALFMKDERNIVRNCPVSPYKRNFFARPLASNLFFFFGARPEVGQIACSGTSAHQGGAYTRLVQAKSSATEEVIRLPRGRSMINIPNNCHLQAGAITLTPETVEIASEIFTLKMPPDFEQNIIMHGKPSITVHEADYGNFGSFVGIDTIPLGPIQRAGVRKVQFIFILILMSVIISIVLGVTVYFKYCFAKVVTKHVSKKARSYMENSSPFRRIYDTVNEARRGSTELLHRFPQVVEQVHRRRRHSEETGRKEGRVRFIRSRDSMGLPFPRKNSTASLYPSIDGAMADYINQGNKEGAPDGAPDERSQPSALERNVDAPMAASAGTETVDEIRIEL